MFYTDIIFVFLFLPITLIVTLFDQSSEYKNFILIISSIIFFTWARPFIIVLLFLSVIIDYLCGLSINKFKSIYSQRAALFFDFLMNLSLFIIFGCNYLFDGIEKLSLTQKFIPIGIAFYTLRGFTYVFDVYSKKINAERNIFCLLTYMVSYHFMLAGPIIRYGDIKSQIRNRNLNSADFSNGINRFILGLFKTTVISSAFLKLSSAGLDLQEVSLTGCWLGMIAFIAWVYFIYTGYMDIVIGLGRLNGFSYPENFKAFSLNEHITGMVKSFNITLVNFFEDVVIKPLSKKKITFAIGIIISSAVMALWYAPKKNFLLAGIIIAVIVLIEKAFFRESSEKKAGIISVFYTLGIAFFMFGVLYFSRLNEFQKWAEGLLGIGTDYILSKSVKSVLVSNAFLFIIGIILAVPVLRKYLVRKIIDFSGKSARNYGVVRISQTVIACVMLLIYTVNAVNLV